MSRSLPCVLMRAGTSRGPFFLKEWLPQDPDERDQALIGAIGASDPLQLDGVGGGSTLNSKVAIVSRSQQPGCDLDYLFAQVGVGHRSVDTRPNCGNMLSGVAPFAIEQGLIEAQEGTTRVRIFNVNTRSRIDAIVRTPNKRVTYEGDARIDGVAGTAAPILLNFLDAWGAITGHVFPTGRRIDTIDGIEVTCIDAAMALMIVRASDLGVSGTEKPSALDSTPGLLERLEALRLKAGLLMGLGDVSQSVMPKPVLVSAGDSPHSITSRYFTPHRCHASHAVTGAIGVLTAFALPGTVASTFGREPGSHGLVLLHPAGRIDVEVELEGVGDEAAVTSAALVRTARKIMQGEMQLPDYVFTKPEAAATAPAALPRKPFTIIVPTRAGGANDTMARIIAARLTSLLGQDVLVDNRAGANGAIASEYVAHAEPDGHTLMFGYVGTHAMNPALQKLGYDPVEDFVPIGLVGSSPTLMVVDRHSGIEDVAGLVRRARQAPGGLTYASAGDGTPPHFAAELFQLSTGTRMAGRTYDGAGPAIVDTLDGRAEVMFPSLFTAHPFILDGRLRALAVAGAGRLPGFSEVPTLAEAGIEGVDVAQWYGLFAPAGTPPDVVERINRALNEVLADPQVVERFERQGAKVEPGAPAALRVRVREDLARWQGVVARSALAPQDQRLLAME
jgi:2-methylaconitate cis-trans-isomerase PrpF/tripartite-type tricarboxylate transporter receptor subunit TctC